MLLHLLKPGWGEEAPASSQAPNPLPASGTARQSSVTPPPTTAKFRVLDRPRVVGEKGAPQTSNTTLTPSPQPRARVSPETADTLGPQTPTPASTWKKPQLFLALAPTLVRAVLGCLGGSVGAAGDGGRSGGGGYL